MAQAATATARRSLLRDRRRNRSRIAAALRQAAGKGMIPDLGFGGYFKAADSLCDIAADATDKELDAFLEDAVGNGNGAGFELFERKAADQFEGNAGILDIITQLLPILLPLIIGCFA